MRFAFSIFALALATASCVEAESCGASGGEQLALLQLRSRANATERSEGGAGGGGSMTGLGAFPGFDFGGGGFGGGGGDTQGAACKDKAGGFKCPKKHGCPSGNCREDAPGGWKSWVDAHNLVRCMHNAPPLSWSNEMYKNVKSVFEHKTGMGHSDCYGLSPPAGPAGENLAWASWQLSAEEATQMWYDEVKDCGPFPGCKSGGGMVGHFTALIWDNAREIGCHANKHGLRACQYKGADTFDCTTPNNARFYTQNVFAPVVSKAECERKLKKCASGESLPDPDPQEHEEPDPPADPRRRSRPDPRRRSRPDPRRRSRPVSDPRRRSRPERPDPRRRSGSGGVERAEDAAERAEEAAVRAEEAAKEAEASAAAASKNDKQKEKKKKKKKGKKEKMM